MRRFYLDTEFNEMALATASGRIMSFLDLISIALVDETGKRYYAVSNEFDEERAQANPWLAHNVLTKLPPRHEWKSRERIRGELLEFIGEEQARFYYWFIGHDIIMLHQLFAASMNLLPANVQGVAFNLAQTYIEAGQPDILPPEPADKHHALADALWTKEVGDALQKYLAGHAPHFKF